MSYTLRTITSDSLERNTFLGKEFNWVERDLNPVEFEKCYNAIYKNYPDGVEYCSNSAQGEKREHIGTHIYAAVVAERGSEIYFLDKKARHYIVTESGSTFKNLTFK